MKKIHKISLKHFKCFKEKEFNLKNLNVLTGINSSGKSTLIQSLLILRQSFDARMIESGLLLNSTLIDLGTIQDVRYDGIIENDPNIQINIQFGDIDMENDYIGSESESDFMKSTKPIHIPDDCNLFSDGFNYISSDRIGPQKIYSKSYSVVKENRSIGLHGELFAHMYQLNKEAPTILADTLENDLSRWLSEISPGFSIDTLTDSKSSQVIELTFNAGSNRQRYKSINVGFGLSYIAPVIVALLMSKKGDLLIIESPEAHLHPKGQRKMGELLAKISEKGVQVIVETHSDHVINGIRLAVKNKQISKENVNFMYFYRDSEGHEVDYIEVLNDGQLSHWPDGFFDEWDNALFDLLRRE